MIGLVKSGIGVGLLPGYVGDFVVDLGLAWRPLPTAPGAHPIALIRRWNARLSNPAETLIDGVKALLAPRMRHGVPGR